MNLLQLAHRLPWPPIDGGKKGTLGFVDGYRSHPQIEAHTLLCMCPEEEADWSRQWKPEGVDVQVELMDARNSPASFIGNTLFSSWPFNMAKYRRATFDARVRAALERQAPDVAHFDSLHTAWYAPTVRRFAPGALRVLRCHNAEHVILERLAQTETNPIKRALIAVQARRLKAYEAARLDDFDLILAITEDDAARFRAMNPGSAQRMIIVPAGADLPATLPAASAPPAGTLNLIHIAAMDWLPNQAGLRWFIGKVLPRLDSAGVDYHLDVVGKNMPAEFLALGTPRVTMHGFVQDLAPLTRAAHLAVVPLQVGGGMRVKILDYWAMGIPVVSTRVGAEGLAGDGPEVVALADDPDAFAARIASLGADASARQALRSAAFDKVSAHYGWPRLVNDLMQRYRRMCPRLAGGGA